MAFTRATKSQAKLRLALIGPAGSGKTFTALSVASSLGDNPRIAVVDTEHGSASKYADRFTFDTLEPDSFAPSTYVQAIRDAEAAGYTVLILDSLSHAWSGKGGALEMVDEAARRSKSANTFGAWRDVTPEHNAMVDAIVGARLHIIATLRSKTEYVQEKGSDGRTQIRKVGLQPVQRDGLEYEFDVTADLDVEHNDLIVGKTRCPELQGKTFRRAGADLAAILTTWLSDGSPAPEKPAPTFTPSESSPRPAEERHTLKKATLAKLNSLAARAVAKQLMSNAQWTERLGKRGVQDAQQLSEEQAAELIGKLELLLSSATPAQAAA